MNDPFEMIRVTDRGDIEGLYPIIKGMVDSGNGSLNVERLIKTYERNVEDPLTLLVYARNGQGVIGYIYVDLMEIDGELTGAVQQLHTKRPFVKEGLYTLAAMWAKSKEATSMKAIVPIDKSKAMARLFGADIQGVVLEKRI